MGHYSRLKLIAHMKYFRWIYLRAFAGSEINGRSWFLDPLLATNQDRIEEWEDLKRIQCLDCVAITQQRFPLACRSHSS